MTQEAFLLDDIEDLSDGYNISPEEVQVGSGTAEFDNVIKTLNEPVPPSTAVGFPGVTFFMRAIDLGGPFPSYHTWQVVGSPDTDGSEAGTLPFGGPLSEITVIGTSE